MSRLKRVFFWQVTLLPIYMLCCLGLVFASGYEAAEHGPYTSRFNRRLKAQAEQAHLVGGPVDRVAAVLGSPDNVMESWEVMRSDGRPARGAEFVTTYEYYPYPWLPFSKFQVHTMAGVVRSLEMFDD